MTATYLACVQGICIGMALGMFIGALVGYRQPRFPGLLMVVNAAAYIAIAMWLFPNLMVTK